MGNLIRKWKILILSLFGLALLSGVLVWNAGWLQTGQKLEGRLVDYHKVYDGWWDVACDTAMDGTDRRCYIQYVDVYRPRPDFAAAMVSIVYQSTGTNRSEPFIRFDIEPGLSFSGTKMFVESDSGLVPIQLPDCPSNSCSISGRPALGILENFHKGNALRLEIDEGRAERSSLNWPLSGFNRIMQDFEEQRRLRDLP